MKNLVIKREELIIVLTVKTQSYKNEQICAISFTDHSRVYCQLSIAALALASERVKCYRPFFKAKKVIIIDEKPIDQNWIAKVIWGSIKRKRRVYIKEYSAATREITIERNEKERTNWSSRSD